MEQLWVYFIGPYKISKKGREPIILKTVTMIYPITGWFEITEYNNNKAMMIENLVETTWVFQYPWPVEITHERGGKLIGYQSKSILIEKEYGIKTKPDSP